MALENTTYLKARLQVLYAWQLLLRVWAAVLGGRRKKETPLAWSFERAVTRNTTLTILFIPFSDTAPRKKTYHCTMPLTSDMQALRDYVMADSGAQRPAESTRRLLVTHSNLKAKFMEIRLDMHVSLTALLPDHSPPARSLTPSV